MSITLILVDDDGGSYTFSPEFWTFAMPFSLNRSYEHRTNSAGAEDVSDGMPKERLVTIEGAIRANDAELSTLETFREFWNNKVIRLLMVVALANVGSMIGTFIALPYLINLGIGI